MKELSFKFFFLTFETNCWTHYFLSSLRIALVQSKRMNFGIQMKNKLTFSSNQLNRRDSSMNKWFRIYGQRQYGTLCTTSGYSSFLMEVIDYHFFFENLKTSINILRQQTNSINRIPPLPGAFYFPTITTLGENQHKT